MLHGQWMRWDRATCPPPSPDCPPLGSDFKTMEPDPILQQLPMEMLPRTVAYFGIAVAFFLPRGAQGDAGSKIERSNWVYSYLCRENRVL